MQWRWWNESIFFLLYQGFLWPYYESSSCLKKCKSFPRWLHASWWYPYKRWRLNKAAWYGHSTLIRTVGMVLIWIHQPSDQDYWSRPDHPKIVKTPPAISRYDGGHASLLIWGMIEQSTSINTLCQNAIQEKLWWCWQCCKETCNHKFL